MRIGVKSICCTVCLKEAKEEINSISWETIPYNFTMRILKYVGINLEQYCKYVVCTICMGGL